MKNRTGITCIRQSLFAINTLLWILGCAIVTVGVWLRLSFGEYATVLHQYRILSFDSLCLITGVTTFLVSFFACCGAWLKNRCLLMTYFLLLTLVFVLQLAIAVTAFTLREPLTNSVYDELKEGIRLFYNTTETNSLAATWDMIQANFRCCGVTGTSDWFDITAWPGQNWVPVSCCQQQFTDNPNCGRSNDEGLLYQNGCFDQVRLWFIQRLHVFGIAALVVFFLQLFGLISSMLLFCSIDNRKRSRTYRSYQIDS